MNIDCRHDRSFNCKDRRRPRWALVATAACAALLCQFSLGCEERERQDREYKTDPAELAQALAETDTRDGQLEILALLAAADDGEATTDSETRQSIRRLIHSDDPLVAAKAGEVLAKWGDEEVVASLVALLRHSDPLIRISAASSLAITETANAATSVAAALGDADENVRAQACRTLAKLDVELQGQPLDSLRQRLADDRPSVRAAAAYALGRVGSLADAELLRAALGDPVTGVVVEAAKSLGRLQDATSLPALIDLLRNGEQATRVAAAWALGRIRDDAALQPLIEQLSHPDTIVRGEVIRSLRELRHPSSLRPILGAALDDDPLIQTYVPIVVGYLYEPQHRDLLLERMASPEAEMRSAAAFALGVAGERGAIPRLLAGAADPDHRVRSACLSALSLLGATEAIETIENAYYNDPNPLVRDSAKVALAIVQIDAPDLVVRLIQALANETDEVRLAATTLLTALKDERAVGPLRLLFDDEAELVRNAAEYGVKYILDDE